MSGTVANLRPNRPGESGPALRHGAHSAIHLRPRAAEIAAQLNEIVPARASADEPAIALASIVLAQVESISSWLDEHGVLDGRGQPRPACRHFGTMVNSAARLLRDLGLTPTSRAAMGADMARVHAEAARDEMRQRYLPER